MLPQPAHGTSMRTRRFGTEIRNALPDPHAPHKGNPVPAGRKSRAPPSKNAARSLHIRHWKIRDTSRIDALRDLANLVAEQHGAARCGGLNVVLSLVLGLPLRTRPFSVLCDLRPAFEGYYGIAQETRMMFELFRRMRDIDTTGLLHHPSKPLARTVRERDGTITPARRIASYARLAASLTAPEIGWARLSLKATDLVQQLRLQMRTALRLNTPLDHFDGTDFGDFLWQMLFARSLPASSFELCRTARYASLWAPWAGLHATALVPGLSYPRIDTTGFDIFIAQTPWPGRVSPETQLIVRYHDAVPVFMPHTIKHSNLHLLFHSTALRANAASGIFACVSEFTRRQLLQLYPELEDRAFVVHDIIAEDYHTRDPQPRRTVLDIIRSRLDTTTARDTAAAAAIAARSDEADDFRFVLVVGALEPRKNLPRLFEAWQQLRSRPERPSAIVCVGSAGWNNATMLGSMQSLQRQGELLHLSSVAPAEMRVLYSAAEFIVCPSVSEGFDLPSVEAIRCGGAVAASDIPVHRELLGDAAIYFDPYSSENMADAMERLLTDADLKRELQAAAARRAPSFDKTVVEDQWRRVFEHVGARQG